MPGIVNPNLGAYIQQKLAQQGTQQSIPGIPLPGLGGGLGNPAGMLGYGATPYPSQQSWESMGITGPDMTKDPAKAGKPGAQSSLMDQFQAFLDSIGFNPNAGGSPDLTGAVADQYNPILGYLKKSIGRTKKEGAQSSEKLDAIYRAAAKMNERSANRMTKMGNRITKRMGTMYDSQANRANKEINNTQQEVMDRLQGLGLNESIGTATAPLARVSEMTNKGIANSKAAQINSQLQGSNSYANYARSSAQNARLEGANAQADLAQQISDLVFGLRGQIAQTKSDKAAAMAQALAAQGSSSNDAAMQQAALLEQFLGMQPQPQQVDPASLTGTDAFKYGVQNVLRGSGYENPRQGAGSALDLLLQLQGSTPSPNDMSGTNADLKNTDFYNMLQNAASQSGLDPEIIKAIMANAPQYYNYAYGQ